MLADMCPDSPMESEFHLVEERTGNIVKCSTIVYSNIDLDAPTWINCRLVGFVVRRKICIVIKMLPMVTMRAQRRETDIDCARVASRVNWHFPTFR